MYAIPIEVVLPCSCDRQQLHARTPSGSSHEGLLLGGIALVPRHEQKRSRAALSRFVPEFAEVAVKDLPLIVRGAAAALLEHDVVPVLLPDSFDRFGSEPEIF